MAEMGVREARDHFGELVDRARLRGETTMITRYGKLVAKIVPVEDPAQEDGDDHAS